ncbi:MAG: hypothetical protein PHQ05_04245 [Sterolibacterium sp.]|nr:hypothetical protein [Sterolibacterium sp.]
MRQAMARNSQSRRNLRLSLALGAIALTFFFGYILHSWLFGP